MTVRPRTSTLVIIGLFLAVLALYILVRPGSASTVQHTRHAKPAPTSTTPAPAVRPSPAPTPSRTPGHSASPTHTASPSPSGTPTPSQTQTPTPGTTPTSTQLPTETPSAPSPAATTPVPGSS
jgi:hypothetical protein